MRKLIYLTGLLFLVAGLFSCVNTGSEGFPIGKVSSNLESTDSSGRYFTSRGVARLLFNSVKQSSTREHHSGKHSVFVDKKQPFALNTTLEVGPDWYFKVSVWRKSSDGKGVAVVAANNPKQFYKVISEVVERDDNGWEKLESTFWTSPLFTATALKFYVWNNGSSDKVFFDDIAIERLKGEHFPVYNEKYFKLMIDSTAFQKLYKNRRAAFANGVLQSTGDDWVNGMVFWNNEVNKVKLRLKGDWLDHLEGFKWSYRIKIKKGKAWNRLRTFSVQTPVSRFGVSEWFVHRIYDSVGILTTRYGFMPLSLNGKNLGLYAWEEHFEKQLVEFHRYREGPILRFYEDANWDANRYLAHHKKPANSDFFDAAVIKPFGVSRIVKDPGLYRSFIIGQNLLYQYKYRLKPASDVFNIDALAKFYALSDVLMTRHGTIWHNIRYYYNPVLCKLEPIAYDCYTETGFLDWVGRPVYGWIKEEQGGNHEGQYLMSRALFNDFDFLKLYTRYLETYSAQTFLKDVSSRYSGQAEIYGSLIRMEYPEMKFDTAFLFSNAKKIRKLLPEFKNYVAHRIETNQKFKNQPWKPDFDSTLEPYFIDHLTFGYVMRQNLDSVLVRIVNLYPEKLVLKAFLIGDKRYVLFPEEPVTLPAFHNNKNNFVDVWIAEKPGFFVVKLPGTDKQFELPVYPWPQPTGKESPWQVMKEQQEFPDPDLVDRISGDTVFVKQEKLTLDHKVMIPRGYRVVFSKGTTIDLIKNAAILSYSPVFINGTKSEPVVFVSSDHSANGFAVLQAGERSRLEYARFEGLNTLSFKGWNLTGAVTFYESDVDVLNCGFVNNSCEDALNIVRSEFLVKNSIFDHTFGDAFDADFSTGLVDSVLFTQIGNDAIDFSGSRISVINSIVRGAGDKGVSAGEGSKLTVNNIQIEGANIGLASKDLSVLTVKQAKISNCKYGVVLLQKKPEYGPAVMKLTNIDLVGNQTKYLIEKRSKVVLDGRVIMGDRKKVAKMFY